MSSSIDFTIIVDFPIKNGGFDLLVYQAGNLKGQSPVDFFVRLPWHWTDSNTGVFIIEIPNSRCFKKSFIAVIYHWSITIFFYICFEYL